MKLSHSVSRAHDRRFPLLCLAPEGTCSDGRHILRFRNGESRCRAVPTCAPSLLCKVPSLSSALMGSPPQVVDHVSLPTMAVLERTAAWQVSREGHMGSGTPDAGQQVMAATQVPSFRELPSCRSCCSIGGGT